MTRKGNKNREGEGERAKRQTRGDDGGRLKIRRDYKWRNKERAEQNVRSGEILTKETRAREGAPEIATDDALDRYKERETAITTKKSKIVFKKTPDINRMVQQKRDTVYVEIATRTRKTKDGRQENMRE